MDLITLRRGKHKGRLLRPARYFGPGGDRKGNFPKMFNTAIYSDDGGKTWNTSAPFPAMGTGEGAVAELSDGDDRIHLPLSRGGVLGYQHVSSIGTHGGRHETPPNAVNGYLYSFWVSPDRSGASHGYVGAGGPGFTGATDTVGMGAYR